MFSGIDWSQYGPPTTMKSNIPIIYEGDIGIYIVMNDIGKITNLQTSRSGTMFLTEYNVSEGECCPVNLCPVQFDNEDCIEEEPELTLDLEQTINKEKLTNLTLIKG